MTAPAFRDWFGIRAEDPPVRRHDFADLLRMAESMLSTRRQRFPGMIAAGELEPDAAGRQAECVIALRWHLEPGRDQIALAGLTHRLRTDAAQRREPAPCN